MSMLLGRQPRNHSFDSVIRYIN